MQMFDAAGYTVIRSAGSHSDWDFVAIGPKETVLVQVKTNRGPGTLERLALTESCPYPHVRRLIHVWRDYARSPQVETL